MEAVEGILVGLVVMATIVALMQIRAAIKRGEHLMTDPGPDPYDYFWRGPMPEGTFSANQPFKRVFMWFGAIMALMGFGWIAINVPEYRTLALIYAGMAVITMVVYIAEEISPLKTETTACMLFGYGKWDEQMFYGVIIGLAFVTLNYALGIYLQVNPLQVKEMPIASFIITVMMVPIVEEGLFRGVIAPSIAEDAGLIHGALISAFAFAMFHGYVYGYNPLAMTMAFLFGVVAALVDFKYKSLLPGAVGHSIVNFFAYINWLGNIFMSPS